MADTPIVIEEIVVADVTTSSLPGSGAFDEFMAAHQVRLEKEFQANRIKASEYAKVYLGAMESSMQQAIAFVLGRQEATGKALLLANQSRMIDQEIINAAKKGELIDAQILKIQAEILIDDKQLDVMDQQIIGMEADNVLKVKQSEKIDAEIDLIAQQILKLKADILIAEQQILIQQQELVLKEKEVDLMDKKLDLMDQEILLQQEQVRLMIAQIEVEKEKLTLMAEQIRKMEHEALFIDTQTQEKYAQYTDKTREISYHATVGVERPVEGIVRAQREKIAADTELVLQNRVVSAFQVPLLQKQALKVDHESTLLTYKGYTEAAQTLSSIYNPDTGQTYSVAADSIIGKQKKLYQAQTDGFARDAEQKLAKIMADTYAVKRSTDESEIAPTSLNASNTNKVIDKARYGIKAT